MIAIPRALPLLLGACTFATTIVTSFAVAPVSLPLPNEVFWDNNNWPSDLISVGDFNSDDDDDDDEKVLDFLPLEHPNEITG